MYIIIVTWWNWISIYPFSKRINFKNILDWRKVWFGCKFIKNGWHYNHIDQCLLFMNVFVTYCQFVLFDDSVCNCLPCSTAGARLRSVPVLFGDADGGVAGMYGRVRKAASTIDQFRWGCPRELVCKHCHPLTVLKWHTLVCVVPFYKGKRLK